MQKLISRKFLVTIAALIALIQGKEFTGWQLALVGAVASVYVIVEAILDHAGLPTLTKELANLVGEGLATGADASEGKQTIAKTLNVMVGPDPTATPLEASQVVPVHFDEAPPTDRE